MKKRLLSFSFLLFLFQLSFSQDCPPATAGQLLSSNNINAYIPLGGSLFNVDGNDPGFEAPALEQAHTIFTQGLWLGAVDPGGNIKVAAQTYGRAYGDVDFFAGPLDEMSNTNNQSCEDWDHVWTVYRYQIEAHLADFADNGVIDNPIPAVLGWPGRGNAHFSALFGFELPFASHGLAPYFDHNGNGIYDPLAGDYPMVYASAIIPEQITWSVFNDIGNVHLETNGDPLNMEIQLTCWVYHCTDNPQLNNTVFTSYKLYNRRLETLDSVHFGSWLDFDLGCFTDDLVGSSPELNTIFAYNETNTDGPCIFGATGYGENPPVQAMTFLNKEMSYAMYTTNPSITAIPNSETDHPTDFYRYLTGHWPDGTPLQSGGNGYDTLASTPPTNFVFPGDPNNHEEWSQLSAGAYPADVRMLGSINLGTMPSGAIHKVDIAYSFFREPGADHLGNVTAMYAGVADLRSWYASEFQTVCSQPPFCEDDCIWAGDLNADGIANHCDLLAIAVAENNPGPSRDIPYNWTPQNGEDWSGNLNSGANYKHIDADGSGTIALEDFLLTYQHYNLTVPGYEPPEDVYQEGPELQLISVSTNFFDFNDLAAGDNSGGFATRIIMPDTIPELYALAFSLEYDTTYFSPFYSQTNSGFDSFIQRFSTGPDYPITPGQYEFAQIDNIGASAGGLLSSIYIEVKDQLPSPLPDTTEIRFKNIKAIRADGTEIAIGGTTVLAIFPDNTVGTENQLNDPSIRLFPNPTNGRLELRFPGRELEEITLFDARGVAVWRQQEILRDEARLDVHHLPSGIYFVRMQLDGGIAVRRVVVQNRE